MEEIVYQLISQKLRQRRKEQGFSQENVSQAIGLSRTSIVNFENGRQRLPIHNIYQIARLVDLSIQEVFPTFEELKKVEIKRSNTTEILVFKGKEHEVPSSIAAFVKQKIESVKEEDDEKT